MNIEICKLTPELVEDYLHFFDTTPHATKKDEHKCYCVWWCGEDYEGKDLASSPQKRRDYARQCIDRDIIQGYLAYFDGKVVGWCNANAKMACLKCYGWRRFMGEVPTEELTQGVKVRAIFCFAVAPEMQRMGIADTLVKRVCLDAAKDGFDFVEAYPNKTFINAAEDFMGPAELYGKNGFFVYAETEEKFVMRKHLK